MGFKGLMLERDTGPGRFEMCISIYFYLFSYLFIYLCIYLCIYSFPKTLILKARLDSRTSVFFMISRWPGPPFSKLPSRRRPETLNPKPYTLHPKPYTLNPKP